MQLLSGKNINLSIMIGSVLVCDKQTSIDIALLRLVSNSFVYC